MPILLFWWHIFIILMYAWSSVEDVTSQCQSVAHKKQGLLELPFCTPITIQGKIHRRRRQRPILRNKRQTRVQRCHRLHLCPQQHVKYNSFHSLFFCHLDDQAHHSFALSSPLTFSQLRNSFLSPDLHQAPSCNPNHSATPQALMKL